MAINWTNESLDAACNIIHGGGFARGKRKLRLEMKKALDAAIEAQGLIALSDDSSKIVEQIIIESLKIDTETEEAAVDTSN